LIQMLIAPPLSIVYNIAMRFVFLIMLVINWHQTSEGTRK
jgi:hypothetical protein